MDDAAPRAVDPVARRPTAHPLPSLSSPIAGARPGVATRPDGARPRTTVTVPSTLKASLTKGHPWIYRDHLPSNLEVPSGSWVKVLCDGWTGIGLYDATSPLAIRIFSHTHTPTEPWLERRVLSAWRRRMPLLKGGHTNAYRLLNGEGDGLPGIVVDVYGATAVLRLDSVVVHCAKYLCQVPL